MCSWFLNMDVTNELVSYLYSMSDLWRVPCNFTLYPSRVVTPTMQRSIIDRRDNSVITDPDYHFHAQLTPLTQLPIGRYLVTINYNPLAPILCAGLGQWSGSMCTAFHVE